MGYFFPPLQLLFFSIPPPDFQYFCVVNAHTTKKSPPFCFSVTLPSAGCMICVVLYVSPDLDGAHESSFSSFPIFCFLFDVSICVVRMKHRRNQMPFLQVAAPFLSVHCSLNIALDFHKNAKYFSERAFSKPINFCTK